MKIRVSLTVDIDAAAWATEYGLDADEVRADVQVHVKNSVQDHLSGLGLLQDQA